MKSTRVVSVAQIWTYITVSSYISCYTRDHHVDFRARHAGDHTLIRPELELGADFKTGKPSGYNYVDSMQLCYSVQLKYQLKSIFFWDMTPCSALSGTNALHGVISQKKILFKTTAVKTSNPTKYQLFVLQRLEF
jgi:hypothetical protein